MKITASDLRHLAALSKLSLSDAELAKLLPDLQNIIGYIEQLRELNTDGVEPTFQTTGLQNVFREDVVQPQVPRESLLALAPQQENNQVKVPKVL